MTVGSSLYIAFAAVHSSSYIAGAEDRRLLERFRAPTDVPL